MFLKRSMRQQTLGQFFTPRAVTRPMIRMARLHLLAEGATVLDPACGVGGFILEPLLLENAHKGNLTFERGAPKRRIRTVGVDLDPNTHILAKANMLLHLAEAVRDPTTTVSAINDAMAETLVLMNGNQTMGALEYPPRAAADVILTNPPYVTSGSAVYRTAIANVVGERNEVSLRTYYDRCGLGLESYFIRYIAGALKPGDRAFVILPLGMLNRTESGPKARLLEECDVVASIQLPRNAFFNTAQKTYIMVLEKRHAVGDPRPDVFCAVTRSIGETLDYLRLPTPEKNDLAEVAEAFVSFCERGAETVEGSPLIKLLPANEFGADQRWDVARFWSDEEKVALDLRDPVIEPIAFIEDVQIQMKDIGSELETAKAEIVQLTSGLMTRLNLSDEEHFIVRAGKRMRTKDIVANLGSIPVYSCFRNATLSKGKVNEEWLQENEVPIENRPVEGDARERAVVTVNANGASVGMVFVRRDLCALTDDVIAIDILSDEFDPDYVAAALRVSIAAGNFEYEAKLFRGRVQQLHIQVPTKADESFNLNQQKRIASAMTKFDSIRERLADLGKFSAEARVA